MNEHSSETLRPCRNATRIIVTSRNPHRLPRSRAAVARGKAATVPVLQSWPCSSDALLFCSPFTWSVAHCPRKRLYWTVVVNHLPCRTRRAASSRLSSPARLPYMPTKPPIGGASGRPPHLSASNTNALSLYYQSLSRPWDAQLELAWILVVMSRATAKEAHEGPHRPMHTQNPIASQLSNIN